MTSAEIRQSFLDFFRSKQHTIVPSSSLLPDSPNLLFTNAGMNQFVPVFLGQAPCPYRPGRAADTQKCIRAGGKHNDLEDVGLDTYHHTFFEMLGNWSFGDYFKREAIDWAWELITEVWRFPKTRLYATVYRPDPAKGEPSQFDQEAYDLWAAKFVAAGLDPKTHIQFGGKKDNFWMMGETGPCGPCSEIHIDLTPEGNTQGALVNRATAQCIEIWNLVFIQFNANPGGTFSELPARHVDTGMGFERVTGILQNTKNFTDFSRVISNYETDIFRPLFDRLEALSGRRYGATLPASPAALADSRSQIALDVAFRVIADHIRTLSFAVADGIAPGNTDRNYVLRRILRRAVRYGRTLGFHEPFFYQLVDVLANTMGDVFPEVREKRHHVQDIIRGEEEAFNKTLDRGLALFQEEAERLLTRPREVRVTSGAGPTSLISGDFAFRLYDEQGFPLDLTELMARERGLGVDTAGFETLMAEQRARGRAAQKKQVIEVQGTYPATEFVGYDQLATESVLLDLITRVRPDGNTESFAVVDRCPFYAEMGGQVGDTGSIQLEGRAAPLRVVDTGRRGSVSYLKLDPAELGLALPTGSATTLPSGGQPARLMVDTSRRRAIQRHHTVTHLLHWALHEIVSPEAAQKGSFVGPEKLTFDFNSAPLTPAQVAEVERLVNERIVENAAVSWLEAPYAEIKARRDIMQFFGEKYGTVVRVVQIGGRAGHLDGYSMELCGGTHTNATGEIGLFRIVGEGAIAAGVRRIEAVAGLCAYEAAKLDLELLKAVALRVNSPVGELEMKIETLLAQQRELEKQLKGMQLKQATEIARGLAATAKARVHQAAGAGLPVIVENLGSGDGDFLQAVADALKGQFQGVVVLGGVANGAVALVATVSPEFTSRIQAGKILQAIAPIVGGKGGGRPDNARGGGKDSSKLSEALARAQQML